MSSRIALVSIPILLAVVACPSNRRTDETTPRRSDEATSPAPTVAASKATTFSQQVTAGQELFAQNCAKCHGHSGEGGATGPMIGPRLVGLKQGALPVDPPADRKFRNTRFVTVGDVADFVVANMPPKKAGSLTSDEYWAILAFALDANGIDLDRKLGPELAAATPISR
jgi:cytochrome c